MQTPSTIVSLFERQVRHAPEAIAVVADDVEVSYRELDARSDQLAMFLRDRNVSRDSIVCLCLDRSVEFVVGMLAVLKAGGVCAPLDPSSPVEHLDFVVRDSCTTIVLTKKAIQSSLKSQTVTKVILDDMPTLSEHNSTDLTMNVQVNDSALILYTSGTTGVPKGVLIHHASLANLAAVHHLCFDITYGSRALLFGAINHGNAVFTLLVTISSGATIVIDSYEAMLPGPSLLRVLEQRRISHLHIPPTALGVMPEAQLPDLRVLTVGGEGLPLRVARQWSIGRRFYNTYGTTESNWLAFEHIQPNSDDDVLSIGRPIANQQCWVVDEQLLPVPAETLGELLVAGIGLAHGYHGRADLTAEKFITFRDPAKGPVRAYRTGDRAYMTTDGRIVLVGRRDSQVSIHGYRVELGAVEAALIQCPGVASAAALVKSGGDSITRLKAFVVADSGASLTATGLRESLKPQLHNYAIPNEFWLTPQLPLLPNGKLDRLSLGQVQATRLGPGENRVQVKTPTQEKLSLIWADLLGQETIGLDDEFFSLGGDSIQVVQLVLRVDEVMGIELPVAAVFDHTTLRALSDWLDATTQQGKTSACSSVDDLFTVITLQEGGDRTPVFFLLDRFYEVKYSLRMVQYFERDRPIYGIRARDEYVGPVPFQCIETLAGELIPVILKSRPRGEFFLLGYSFAGLLTYETARQLQTLGRPSSFVGIIDAGPKMKPTGLSERLQYFCLFLKNLPSWVFNLGAIRLRIVVGNLLQANFPILANAVKPVRPGLPEGFEGNRRHDLPSPWEMARSYNPKPFNGKISLFRASVNPLTHSLEPDLGWTVLVKSIDIHSIPGAHDSLLSEKNMPYLVEQILKAVD